MSKRGDVRVLNDTVELVTRRVIPPNAKKATEKANEPSADTLNSSTTPVTVTTQNPENQSGFTKLLTKIKNWSTQQKIIAGVIISSIVAILILVIVLAAVLSRRGTTATTTVVTAYWPFDGNVTDTYGVYNGQMVNSATYTAVSSTQPYLGNGRALSVTSSSSQSFTVTTPFLNLAYTSFTVEAWIYLTTSSSSDFGIFGQCQCATCSNQCLYILIRGYYLYAGFTLNDLSGNTTISTNTWYYITFVYNYQTYQQILYVNGVQDSIKSSAQPYQGTNGSIVIGSTQVYQTTNYFNGYIDNVKLTTRAKSATEILTVASLMAYFAFDLPSPTVDGGPNGMSGTAVGTATVSGRVNQALRFSGSSSYFQAYGFYQIPYGVVTNKPFSISLWINPTLNTPCVFVQVSSSQTSGSCTNVLGIWSSTSLGGQITAQIYGSNWPTIFGPFVTANTWTHISWTYGTTNGYSLYVNGVAFGSTGTSTYYNTGVIMWLQFGYAFSCGTYSNIINTGYQGSIDEVYVHNRELAATEVYAFANP